MKTELVIWDDHGERSLSHATSDEELDAALEATNWDDPALSGVALRHDRYNWAEASGSLDPSVGVALWIEDNGVQHLAVNPPTSREEIREFLRAYRAGDIHRVYELLEARSLSHEEVDQFRHGSEDGSPVGFVLLMLGLLFVAAILMLVL